MIRPFQLRNKYTTSNNILEFNVLLGVEVRSTSWLDPLIHGYYSG